MTTPNVKAQYEPVLSRLTDQEGEELCAQLRRELVEDVSSTGGHLASNLGAVELTVALHRVFDTSVDRLVFDVGHQCYPHKMLTGRREAMSTLRQYGGIAGFPKPNELVKNAEVPGGMYSNMVAQLKALNSSDLLDDAMKLIPKVRRDAGLVPLVTPTSQIVGAQAVNLAIDRKKGNPDYTNTSNQFISLVKGEYGHTPAPIDPAFRQQITGDAVEHPYDVSKYRKPEIPVVPELGGVKLATNTEEELLMELLPNVANKFLRNRREEEYAAKQPKDAPKAAAEVKVEETVTSLSPAMCSAHRWEAAS